jgi:hypothetical protein
VHIRYVVSEICGRVRDIRILSGSQLQRRLERASLSVSCLATLPDIVSSVILSSSAFLAISRRSPVVLLFPAPSLLFPLRTYSYEQMLLCGEKYRLATSCLLQHCGSARTTPPGQNPPAHQLTHGGPIPLSTSVNAHEIWRNVSAFPRVESTKTTTSPLRSNGTNAGNE